jgi:hypothetical protein
MGLKDYKEPEKKQRRGMWPVYGLFMAIALGAISYVLSPELLKFIRQRSPNFSIGTLPEDQVLLFFGGIIFLILLSFGTLIIAAAVPKKKNQVKDAELVREKKAIEAEQRARKKRQLEIQRKTRDQNRRLE